MIPVSSITVAGTGGATIISTDGGTLQMVATVLPANATNKTVTWSITSGSAFATINSSTGVLTAVDNGSVTVRATATDGSNIYGSTTITISGQVIPVSSITVAGTGGATTISTDGGTLQMVATVLPANATNKTVTWSITSGSAFATINSSTGVLTAVDNGSVTVRATATDGSNIYGSTTITISGQVIPVSSITVAGTGGATTIPTDDGTLQMVATVLPVNATNKTVTWTITSGSAFATINSSTGVLTAADNGSVTVRATATDGSNIYGSTTITISGQVIPVTSITVAGTGGATTISADGGTLQMVATVLPANATNKTVTWTITSGSAFATINSSTGVLTAVDNGSVTVRATATDGSNIYGSTTITISGQVIPVTSITVAGTGGATTISADGGTLQMVATVLPSNATNKTVTWSITSGSAFATINSSTGVLTAVDNGSVTVRATATDGSNVYGSTTITTSGQVIPVSSITVTGTGGVSLITILGGMLQLNASVLPSNASNPAVTWSISSGTDKASISSTGLITALNNGTAVARATANDGSGVFGTLTITISNQVIPVTSITLSGGTAITSDGGTLQLNASVLPSNASNPAVTWSISSGADKASISSTGLVTALDNGTAVAMATANDGSGIFGTLTITISNQDIPVTSITLSGGTAITSDRGTLQLNASVLPSNATNPAVTWSISSGTDKASISSTGLVTALNNGTAVARATANDGSGVFGTLTITISNQVIPVTSITLSGGTAITSDGGTLQLNAAVLPSNATNPAVTWSISSGTDKASISSTGLVTALDNGTAEVRATANDGTGVFGSLTITITNQVIQVSNITVITPGGVTTITADNGTLQLSAEVLPSDATNKTVMWLITSGTNLASINTSGLLTAIDNGAVTVRAEANDRSGFFGTIVITISNQVIPVTGITVTGAGGTTAITTDNGTLQLNALVIPSNASNPSVTWSISSGTDMASISTTGLVTALKNGTSVARATANDGTGVFGSLTITITNQVILVSNITVIAPGGTTTITTDNGTLQLSAEILPSDATNKTVLWLITSGTSLASINPSGLLTAIDNGAVTVRATVNDGSGFFGTIVITISNQVIPVTGISVTGAGGATTIPTDNGTLQLSAAVLPANATNPLVTWSIASGTYKASISSTGLVTALDNGTAIARATANDGSGVFGTLTITISSQVIPVTSVTVSGETAITTDGGTLQLNTSVLPVNATNPAVTWSISSGTDKASISSTGLVTALDNGTAIARATANDGSGVYGTLTITISNQVIEVEEILVASEDGSTSITKEEGTLWLIATVLPAAATEKSVTWSIVEGSGYAAISPTGLVTALSNGTVTVEARANDDSGVTGTISILIDITDDASFIAIVDDNELRFLIDESYLGCKISIYNLYGRLLGTKMVDSNLCIFDISQFSPGLFVGVLSKEMIIKTLKVMIP